MIVEVNKVIHPIGMMDTIIKFEGTNTADEKVTFGVDHRPAKELFGAMKQAHKNGLDPILAEVDEWQILSVECDHVAISDGGLGMVCTKCGIELSL